MFGLEKKNNEGFIKVCTLKGSKAWYGGKVASFLLLCHLVKVFAIVNITKNLAVNYLLNL